jgi:hypothetical protein
MQNALYRRPLPDLNPENAPRVSSCPSPAAVARSQRQRLPQHAAAACATCVPLFLTDGFNEYKTALLTHFGHWMQPERRRDKGPMPRPRGMPLPALLYAQVVKSSRRRRKLCPAPCEPAPALSALYSHEWRWVSQAVAAMYTGDGGRIDGSCLVAQRSVAGSTRGMEYLPRQERVRVVMRQTHQGQALRAA